MTRLLYLVGAMLVLGFAWSMIRTVPAVMAPVPEGEVWRMDPE